MKTSTDNMHDLLDARMHTAATAAALQHTVSLAELSLLDTEAAVRAWNDTNTAAIASELHPETGKPLYSNAEKRSAVLLQLQQQDHTFAVLDADRRAQAVGVLRLRRDLTLARAAFDNLSARIIWAQNLATQPTSLSLLAELIEATTPPPDNWPAGQQGFPADQIITEAQPETTTLQ